MKLEIFMDRIEDIEKEISEWIKIQEAKDKSFKIFHICQSESITNGDDGFTETWLTISIWYTINSPPT